MAELPEDIDVQNSIQFNVSAQSRYFVDILQEKNLIPPWKPPTTAEVGEWVSDSSDSEVSEVDNGEELIEVDLAPGLGRHSRKVLPQVINSSGIQKVPHQEPVLVLTDDRAVATKACLYGLLTCYRYLQKSSIRSKMDSIGVKKKVETGSYVDHTSEYLYLLYSFSDQKSFKDMCENLKANAFKFAKSKSKRSDRIPLSLQPARPIFSKLKGCLEFYIPLISFKKVAEYLDPLFTTLEQSAFFLSANSRSESNKELQPYDPAFAIKGEDELPSFAICIQFINKTIRADTNSLFNKRGWSTFTPLPSNESLTCYVNMAYGKQLPFIFCEPNIDPALHYATKGINFAIYIFVPKGTEALAKMTSFYNTLLSDTGKDLKRGRVMYRLLNLSHSDRELILIEVPPSITIFRQNALTLYIHTTSILSLICNLQCEVKGHGNNCVSVEDPLGNTVVLRDLSSATYFKDFNPSDPNSGMA